jgi:hypothetical protein
MFMRLHWQRLHRVSVSEADPEYEITVQQSIKPSAAGFHAQSGTVEVKRLARIPETSWPLLTTIAEITWLVLSGKVWAQLFTDHKAIAAIQQVLSALSAIACRCRPAAAFERPEHCWLQQLPWFIPRLAETPIETFGRTDHFLHVSSPAFMLYIAFLH